ncbi:MAG TPA: CapA family protein, partial [Solirubrobacterales bacterium]|nr:CapA family protein [Solirubrobacterales bacterium]
MAASPGPGRRRQSQASFRRRRIVAGAIGLAVLVVLAIGLLDGGGIVTDAPQSADEVIQRSREDDPVRFTVSVSGDLLIHSPVYERAQALAGGRGYDFAPMLKQVRPYVRGADLALCHVEVPMTPAPPASFPIFNTPPELADAIAKTGWEACDTASNHSLD